ncbi:MAG: TraB/GumN family protein [Caulobacteraceae bacterium]
MKRSPVLRLALIVLTLAGPAFALPAMWTVKTPRATLILFGSVHLLPPGLEWEPRALRDAVAHANEIWFELPVDQTTEREVARMAAQKGRLPAGDSLFNHLTAVQADHVRKASRSLQIPPGYLAPMRPWLAEVTLSVIQDARDGALPGQGVEQQLSAQTPLAVDRRAFETVREQIGFLAGASMVDQADSLGDTASEITDDPGLFTRVLNEWLAGDLPALAKDAIDPVAAASPEMYRRLITDRNRRWAAMLNQRLKGEGVIVVVVGAGHLLGPGGVPALLRERGYHVEGPGLPPAH